VGTAWLLMITGLQSGLQSGLQLALRQHQTRNGHAQRCTEGSCEKDSPWQRFWHVYAEHVVNVRHRVHTQFKSCLKLRWTSLKRDLTLTLPHHELSCFKALGRASVTGSFDAVAKFISTSRSQICVM
jgi:hypothetical protein